jgi:hypothetical protein
LAVLAVTMLFGACVQWIGALDSAFLTQVSKGLSALWLVIPFAVGASMPTRRRAALMGMAATCAALIGYVLMIVSPMEGTHLGPAPPGTHGTWNQLTFNLLVHVIASQGQWFIFAIIAGPVFAVCGYFFWCQGRFVCAIPLTLSFAVEPCARWAATKIGMDNVPFFPFTWPNSSQAQLAELLEFVLGLTTTYLALHSRVQRITGPRN